MLKANMDLGSFPFADEQARLQTAMVEGIEAALDATHAALEDEFLAPAGSGKFRRSRRAAGARGKGRRHPKAFGGSAAETGPMHEVSLPGNPPHEDTGALRDSIKIDRSKLKGLEPSGSIGWEGEDAAKAESLDKGYPAGNRAPRPFIDEASEKGLTAEESELRLHGFQQ